jgi:hypothetical protein
MISDGLQDVGAVVVGSSLTMLPSRSPRQHWLLVMVGLRARWFGTVRRG